MIINFSPLAAEAQMAADGNGVPFQVVDFSPAESKVIPLFPSKSGAPHRHYPDELTPEKAYIAETRAKLFREASPFLVSAADELDFSVLARALEAEDDRFERIENIIDSGLGRVPSEFFPEAA